MYVVTYCYFYLLLQRGGGIPPPLPLVIVAVVVVVQVASIVETLIVDVIIVDAVRCGAMWYYCSHAQRYVVPVRWLCERDQRGLYCPISIGLHERSSGGHM